MDDMDRAAPAPRTGERPAPPGPGPRAEAVLADVIAADPGRQQENVARIYLEALRSPGLTRAQLVARGFAPEAIDTGVAFLRSAGLVRESGLADAWEAMPPDITLPGLATRLEQQATIAREFSRELALSYHRARQVEEDDEVRVLSSLQELADATDLVRSSARREIRALGSDSPRTAYLFAADLELHRSRPTDVEGQPLRNRITYATGVLDLPQAGDALLARAEAGEEQRFVRDLPFSVLVADCSTAVVDLTAYDSSGRGCLLVRDRRLALALGQLCDTFWHLATPLAGDGRSVLDRRSRTVLSLLAAGATDATIAEKMDVSQRTVERTVRALMTRLGASTRFQAGVQAARRGWLGPRD